MCRDIYKVVFTVARANFCLSYELNFYVHIICMVLIRLSSYIYKEERQCTYDVTSRRVLANIVATE